MNDLPKTVKIIDRTIHNRDNITLHLKITIGFQAGQFLMIWLPGIDEKPFSIAGQNPDGTFITVRRRGDFSSRLCDLGVGDLVGVRGPYGTSFELTENCCLVAGGVGLACLAPIAEKYPHAPILYGENTVSAQFYRSSFPNARLYTVDGSGGIKGFPTDDLEKTISKNQCKMVYCCGPEAMLVRVVEICNALKVRCQVSMERYMKCGTGVCGQCACGPVRTCVEGTVFNGNTLLQNPDFGKRKMDASGAWNAV